MGGVGACLTSLGFAGSDRSRRDRVLGSRWVFLWCFPATEFFAAAFDPAGGSIDATLTRLASRLVEAKPFQLLGFVVLMLGIWIPVLSIVCRQGAALTAGRSMPAVAETNRLWRSRWWRSYLVPLIPAACVVAIFY